MQIGSQGGIFTPRSEDSSRSAPIDDSPAFLAEGKLFKALHCHRRKFKEIFHRLDGTGGTPTALKYFVQNLLNKLRTSLDCGHGSGF